MKKRIFLPAAALGAGVALNYIRNNRKHYKEYQETHAETEPKQIKEIRNRTTHSRISKYLVKILNNIDNDRLLFVEIKLYSRKLRKYIIEQLESLKTEQPVDEMWIAGFEVSGPNIIAVANKKAIFYLANFEEIQKIRVSAKDTALKLIGNSLSRISMKFPSIEKYIFEPVLDLYSPLKEATEIGNFGEVSPGQLYRGGMLVGENNYEQLKTLGVKTVVNLKIEDSAVEYVAEQNALLKKGIHLHYIPMPNVAPPTMLQTMEFLNLVYDLETKPVYVHCHRGADRTGVMGAVFRITQGHTASWALLEAEKYNIASKFFQHKIDFVYSFEKHWLKWKAEGKIPEDLTEFDFMSLMEEEEGLPELIQENDESDPVV